MNYRQWYIHYYKYKWYIPHIHFLKFKKSVYTKRKTSKPWVCGGEKCSMYTRFQYVYLMAKSEINIGFEKMFNIYKNIQV